MSVTFRGTTICAVKRNGHIAIAGDGQVTMGEHTIFKGNARKVRRIFGGQVAVGFAGSVAVPLPCAKSSKKSSPSAVATWSARPWPWPKAGEGIRPCGSWIP